MGELKLGSLPGVETGPLSKAGQSPSPNLQLTRVEPLQHSRPSRDVQQTWATFYTGESPGLVNSDPARNTGHRRAGIQTAMQENLLWHT